MTEHYFDKKDFIGGWYINHSICDNLIKYYKSNKNFHTIGTVGEGNIDTSMKKNTEAFFNVNKFFVEQKQYTENLQEIIKLYTKKYFYARNTAKFKVVKPVKIKHYLPMEGFYNWHMENDGFEHSKNRHLVFMTYLNNVNDGGTEFYYQNLIVPAIKGLTIIWPSQWTHTHRSQISKTNEKYILTGWFNFYE